MSFSDDSYHSCGSEENIEDVQVHKILNTGISKHGNETVVQLFGGDLQNDVGGDVENEGTALESVETGGKRSLTAVNLALIGYFLTCAGPFGIESIVEAGGPLIGLIGLLIFPIFWSIPQALMSAELSLMISENGGNVVWIQRAFGDFLGWMNAYNLLGNTIASMSVTVVLFIEYLPHEFPTWQAWLIKVSFVTFLVLINFVGLSLVTRLSLVFMFMIMAPFVLEVAESIALGYMHPKALADVPPASDINWGLLISTYVYAFGGFDTLGVFAGEVKGGRKSYLGGIFGVLPLDICNYIIPIGFGYMIRPDYKEWESGYFTTVAYTIGSWLGILVVIASAISNFGVVNQVAALSRTLWAMAKPKHQEKKLPTFLYSWSTVSKDGTVRPIAANIAVGALLIALSAFPFNILVELMLVLRILNLNLEYASLIYLRYKEPDTPRPYVVPGGIIVAWLLPVPTLIICIVELALGTWEVVVTGVAFNIGVALLYFIFRLGRKARHKVRSVQRKRSEKLRSQVEAVGSDDDSLIN
eukprot:TRINITY_DN7181_c0_g1_i1.p1 TRINITY_DN7181_c0_g1~~TRINITY_DN7181_c0_g1_i1.p1  ORF type:complete len:528 (-),score=60.97 TRINITY_DN7181_c0_g1_i1:447-2030(-)